MRVAYLVSRFPHVSETFIVREMDAVAAEGVEVLPRSLYPPVTTVVHPAAERWLGALRRPTPREGLAATLRWLLRRPLRLLSTSARVAAGHAGSPRTLVRALATLPLAAAHAWELRDGGVDHVHAHYATYPAQTAWVIWRLTGVPYSFTAHAHDIYVDTSLLGSKLAGARFVAAISEFNRGLLGAHRGGDRTRIEVVHCGVAVESIVPRLRELPPSGPVRALCVASLQEYKGHAVLLDALAATPGLERLELDLVGSGELADELAAQAARLGLADRVRFHGGLTEDAVAARFDGADLFVLPSIVARDGQMEGIPVALMEALAHGVPVVTTRLSGIPELVRDGETGLLAEPGDPSALGAALVALLSSPEDARRRAEAGRALVEREFDIRGTGARMAELLRGAGGR